jgi:hypothetical protein
MKRSHRRTLAVSRLAFSLLAVALGLVVKFAFLPWLQSRRDLQARRDAQRTLALLVQAEKKFAARTGSFTDNLSALKPLLTKLPSNQKLHYGFNPECLRTSGIAHSIGASAKPDLVLKLQGMFAELPCANRHAFTAMVAVRTSQQLEIFVSDGNSGFKNQIATMALTDQKGEAATEIASFRFLLGSLRSMNHEARQDANSSGTRSGSTTSSRP